jgi:NAD-dependent deacetylase
MQLYPDAACSMKQVQEDSEELGAAMERASAAMSNARHIVCFTGAGISAESGIATYREPLTGIWGQHDPQTSETAEAFDKNPPHVWGGNLWRRHQIEKAKPNAAHLVLSQMVAIRRKVSLITQNVDDLHERAGSVGGLQLHGSLATHKCFACHRPAEMLTPEYNLPAEGALVEPLRCVRCNGKDRLGVVWFGEDLPLDVWASAIALVKSCDVMISVGTSGIVTPAADISRLAFSSGATVVHVNTKDVRTGAQNELMLMGKATELLTSLCALLSNKVESL